MDALDWTDCSAQSGIWPTQNQVFIDSLWCFKACQEVFNNDKFTGPGQSQEVKKHTWWALCPNGPAYQANPTPIDCPFDWESPLYVVSEQWLQSLLSMNTFKYLCGKYQSKFIVPTPKKFLSLTEASTIFPKIDAQNPPLGLYILILTAVSHFFHLSCCLQTKYLLIGWTCIQVVLWWYL